MRHCDRSPCGPGATCQEAPGGYQCLCPPGWSGRTCQLGQWDDNLQYMHVENLPLNMLIILVHLNGNNQLMETILFPLIVVISNFSQLLGEMNGWKMDMKIYMKSDLFWSDSVN